MAGRPVTLTRTAAEFSGMDPDDFHDGQRVVVVDDGNREYEARGADGSRTWELLASWAVSPAQLETSAPRLVTTEADTAPPVNVWTEDGTDWIYTEV